MRRKGDSSEEWKQRSSAPVSHELPHTQRRDSLECGPYLGARVKRITLLPMRNSAPLQHRGAHRSSSKNVPWSSQVLQVGVIVVDFQQAVVARNFWSFKTMPAPSRPRITSAFSNCAPHLRGPGDNRQNRRFAGGSSAPSSSGTRFSVDRWALLRAKEAAANHHVRSGRSSTFRACSGRHFEQWKFAPWQRSTSLLQQVLGTAVGCKPPSCL